MLVQHSSCPDLGRAASVDQLLVLLAKNWQRRQVLDQRINQMLAEVCERGVSLRVIHSATRIPRSTAHDRVQRLLADESEAAA